MIEVRNSRVFNFEGAIRGMRNPLESWGKSDSLFGIDRTEDVDFIISDIIPREFPDYEEFSDSYFESLVETFAQRGILYESNGWAEYAFIGKNDLKLAQKLILAGSDHSKFMRQIFVSMDITAPLYWWKEMDQYRIGCTTNSESTMHKLATTPITRDCFSFDNTDSFSPLITDLFDDLIQDLEKIRKSYLETKDVRYWRALIQLLPSSWNQTRTWTADYQVLRAIYFARRYHRLSEWVQFTDRILTLPYAKELITIE